MATNEEVLKMMKDAIASNQNSLDAKLSEEEDSTSEATTYLKKLKEEAKEKALEVEIASIEAQEEKENAVSEDEMKEIISKKMLLEDQKLKEDQEAALKKELEDRYTAKNKDRDPAIEAAYINPEIGSHKTLEPPK